MKESSKLCFALLISFIGGVVLISTIYGIYNSLSSDPSSPVETYTFTCDNDNLTVTRKTLLGSSFIDNNVTLHLNTTCSNETETLVLRPKQDETSFHFNTTVLYDEEFDITMDYISSQHCTLDIYDPDIDDILIMINCTISTYSLSGYLFISASSLVLNQTRLPQIHTNDETIQLADDGNLFAFEKRFGPWEKYNITFVNPYFNSLCDITNGKGSFQDKDIENVFIECEAEECEECVSTTNPYQSFRLYLFHTISTKSGVYEFPVVVGMMQNQILSSTVSLVPGSVIETAGQFVQNDTFSLFFMNSAHEEVCYFSKMEDIFSNMSITVLIDCPLKMMPIQIIDNWKLDPFAHRTFHIESGNILDKLVLWIAQTNDPVLEWSLSWSKTVSNQFNVTIDLFGTMYVDIEMYDNRYNHIAWFDGINYQQIINIDNTNETSALVPVPKLLSVDVDCDISIWVFNSSTFESETATFFLYDDTSMNGMYVSFVLINNHDTNTIVTVPFVPGKVHNGISYWIRAVMNGVESAMSNKIIVH